MKNDVIGRYGSMLSEMEELLCELEIQIEEKNKKIARLKVLKNTLEHKNRLLLDELMSYRNNDYEKAKEARKILEELESKKSKRVKEIGNEKKRAFEVKFVKIFECNKETPKNVIFELESLVKESKRGDKYEILGKYIHKLDFLELNEEYFIRLLKLLNDEQVLKTVDEKYLVDIIKFLMEYKLQYEVVIKTFVKKVLSFKFTILNNLENVKLFIYLNEYFDLGYNFNLKKYEVILTRLQERINTNNLLEFIKNKDFYDRQFDFDSIKDIDMTLECKVCLKEFLDRKYKRKFTQESAEIVSKNSSKEQTDKRTVHLDKVDSLLISNNIKTCQTDKSILVRKRVELAVHNKHNSAEKTMLETSVYHCKECRDYIVNTELIRSIYKSIDIKKNYINFKSTDNLNQVSVINALGYNTNINLKERLETIDNIIIPTVGARKLLHHLEFLVRFQKNNTKDFSHAISVWKHDIAYLKRHYSV
ncbi:MAG: hypothetical protein ACRDCW_15650 [Sarcina sp.]